MTLPYDNLSWIQNGEPVSGGSGGSSEGTTNRPLLQLLENDKSLDARTSQTGILEIIEGAITNNEIAPTANIEESKLNLLFRGKPRVTGGTYVTTAQLADDLYATTSYLKTIVSASMMEQLAALAKGYLAGSGFEKKGKHKLNENVINEGMWVWDKSAQQSKGFISYGFAGADYEGISSTPYPILNANGISIRFDDGRLLNSAYITLDKLPPVSNADVGIRQDFAFVEVWTEKLTDKDFIYPYGNVQYRSDTWNGITLVKGAFTGAESYSNYGSWQAANDLVGYGAVWSTLDPVAKKAFSDDKFNNIFISDGGELIQLRYRIRIIQGISGEWENVSNFTKALCCVSPAQVAPQGLNISANDIYTPTSTINYGSYVAYNDSAVVAANANNGCWVAKPGTNAVAFDNQCYAIPLFAINRRNAGAYHPVFNPMGAAMSTTTANVAVEWYESNRNYTSIADCFSYKTSGNLLSSQSGRPDGLFYDIIDERDILDLRYDSNVTVDYNRVVDDLFFKYLKKSLRGWGGVPHMSAPVSGTLDTITLSSIFGTQCTQLTFIGESLTSSGTRTSIEGVGFISDGLRYYRVVSSIVSTDTVLILDPRHGDLSTTFTKDKSYSFIATNTQTPKSRTVQFAEILGNPQNYPAVWKTYGVYGYPLLADENGDNTLLTTTRYDFTSSSAHLVKCFKLSNVVKYPTNVNVQMLKSNGTWYNHTYNFYAYDTTDINLLVDNTEIVDRGCSFSSTLNTVAINFSRFAPALGFVDATEMALKTVIMFTYEVDPTPFTRGDEATSIDKPVLAYSNVFISNIKGCTLSKHLIGKVSIVGHGDEVGEGILFTVRRKTDGTFSPSSVLRHLAIDVDDGNVPMVKAFPFLSEDGGLLRLNILFGEVTTPSNDNGWLQVTNSDKIADNAICGVVYLNTNIFFKE